MRFVPPHRRTKPAKSPSARRCRRISHVPLFICHEPENTQCVCGCQLQRIGEDVSDKLDYTPGVFTVEQHARGKWACRHCETLIQAPVPAQVIDNVSNQHRGLGAGKALLTHLASLAVEKGCGRLEWSVLDWNTPTIKFYELISAKAQPEWIRYRLARDELERLAGSS